VSPQALVIAAAGVAIVAVLLLGVVRLTRREGDRTASLEAELRSARAAIEALREQTAPRVMTEPSPIDPLPVAVGRPTVPEDLVNAVAAGDCVLFAGAGVGASAGRPTWPELVRLLIDAVEDDDDPATASSSATGLREQLDVGQVELVAQILRSRCTDVQLNSALASVVPTSAGPVPSPLMKSLSALDVTGVVTDDWWPIDWLPFDMKGDDLAVLTPVDAQRGPETLRYRRPFVLHAYGLADRELLLSFDDFSRAVADNRDFGLFLGAVLASRTMLFVGTSLPGIEQFFIGVGGRSAPSRRHFALVPTQTGLELQSERLRERYGVTLIEYRADREHSAVPDFLDELAARASERAKHVTVAPPDVVERLELTNIGLFPHLVLEFVTTWNVLLGDNAVGKSTVLRAIALVLSGESPETAFAPARLLRAGATTGTIALTVGGTTYTTRLTREREQVRAEADQVTPVRSGAWLAVGFPALRGVSTGNPRTSEQHVDRAPSSSDILPLLRDRVDERLDDLKAWIATHWLRSQDTMRRDASRHRQMLATFFSLLTSLTDTIDFKLEFCGVEEQTGRLLMATRDGEVGLDDLSQGLSAFLGGIGVLLQRLYEVYPDDEEPEKRSALLLIDELDVHLHPEWQSALLPTLRETFPNLQLIATTHSPLIVVNTRPGEVHHLRREGDAVVAERNEQRFEGWRADQVLTSAAFRLDTTIDRHTAARLEDYRQRQSDPDATDEQREETEQLGAELGRTIPRPQETEIERNAAKLLDEFLDWRLRQIPREERLKLIEETQVAYSRLMADDEEDDA
jgi:putative AbiEii toxin of type IV toxin-antitoxin system/SIR2-like protein